MSRVKMEHFVKAIRYIIFFLKNVIILSSLHDTMRGALLVVFYPGLPEPEPEISKMGGSGNPGSITC